jgi:hypothetical protein
MQQRMPKLGHSLGGKLYGAASDVLITTAGANGTAAIDSTARQAFIISVTAAGGNSYYLHSQYIVEKII